MEEALELEKKTLLREWLKALDSFNMFPVLAGDQGEAVRNAKTGTSGVCQNSA